MQSLTIPSMFLLFLACIGQVEGLLLHGHSDNTNNTMHGLLGQHVNMEDMVQMLLNLTAEFKHLKQQTAEKNVQIETLKQQTEALKQQTNEKNVEIENLKHMIETLNQTEIADKNILKQQTETLNQNIAQTDTLKQQFGTLQNQTETLQQQNIEKSAQIAALKQQTDNDKVTIQLLQNRVFSLEAEQKKLSNLASNQTQELSAHLSGINQLTRSLIANEATDRNLTQQLNNALWDIQKLKTDRSNNHAFTAGISSHNDGWTGSTLVFPDVVYNVGTGYNPHSGIFTAPTPGTYVFYISVQSALQKYNYLDIVLNGSTKVRAMAWYNSGSIIYQTGTNLVILHLQTGDRVWVRRAGGTGYYSDDGHITTFSGFKLY